jgi:phenylpyruvate tautomerase PptA (4-oxalocrotonate tautomerase family)
MPIVDVEIVLSADERLAADLAQRLADAIGDVFAAPRGHTWVRLRTLARGDYAEHGGVNDDIRPVFATVMKSQRPSGQAMRNEVSSLTGEIARLVNRSPENVHIVYAPDARGRIAFGGQLVE